MPLRDCLRHFHADLQLVRPTRYRVTCKKEYENPDVHSIVSQDLKCSIIL